MACVCSSFNCVAPHLPGEGTSSADRLGNKKLDRNAEAFLACEQNGPTTYDVPTHQKECNVELRLLMA